MQLPHHLVQPVWVLNAGHRVGHTLHGGRDGDDLLDGAAQPFPVVVPIYDAPHIWHLVCWACNNRAPLSAPYASTRGHRQMVSAS